MTNFHADPRVVTNYPSSISSGNIGSLSFLLHTSVWTLTHWEPTVTEKASVASAGTAEEQRRNTEACDLRYWRCTSAEGIPPVPLYRNATGLTFSLGKSRLMCCLAAVSQGKPLFCSIGKTAK